MHTLSALKSGSLTGITRLVLRENLKAFPEQIYSLADSLEILDLSCNQLSALPSDFGRLKKLKAVFLSENKFTHVPSELAQCSALDMIGFKANAIETVAEDALPVKTRWLILTDNKIKSLPDSIGKLIYLQKCMLAGNCLTALPDSMKHNVNLELLRVSANQLSSLPQWLFTLPKLRWLAFAGNPFLNNLQTQTKKETSRKLKMVSFSDVELHEELGAGASGIIYRASWSKQSDFYGTDKRAIAVKLFKGKVTSDGYPLDELKASIHATNSPNLVNVIAELNDGEQNGLVMELISDDYSNLGQPPSFASCTRDTFADGSTIELDTLLAIARKIAETMAELHERGIAHGDLYAHNILINPQNKVLLSDFGAASLYKPDQPKGVDLSATHMLDIRAYGCLLDDLLSLCPEVGGTQMDKIKTIRDDCMAVTVEKRLTFDKVVMRLITKNI